MKVVVIFDQTQAGLGGKESADLGLGGKMMPVGSCSMFENDIKKVGGQIIATLWCGDQTFLDDPETTTKKFCAMIKKIQPDVVIGGPCFNYGKYALMASSVVKMTKEKLDIPAFAMMSEECEEAIATYKEEITILKMPKKGGIGLSDSLMQMSELAKTLSDRLAISEELKEKIY